MTTTSDTNTGVADVLGTPAYMSREQARGDGELDGIGPASDIFGLGEMLLCLLSGESPYQRGSGSFGGLILGVKRADFPLPSKF
jgi:serine/threonine protein kinase